MTAFGRKTILGLLALAGLPLLGGSVLAESRQPTGQPSTGHATTDAAVKSVKDPPLPRPRPANANVPAAAPDKTSTPVQAAAPPPPAGAPITELPSLTELNTVRQAFEQIRKGRQRDASDLARGLKDPVASKVVEWLLLRSDDNTSSFDRYASFISNNPNWPSVWLFRRRAEATLWQERREAATVRAYFRNNKPVSAKGKFALARALAAQGEREEAQAVVRDVWHNDPFPADIEATAHDLFEKYLTREDYKIRMDRRLNVEDVEAGMRAAGRLGGVDLVIARARVAVIKKENHAAALLEAVPASARTDAGYILSKAALLRRQEKIAEAGALMLTLPHDNAQLYDADELWIERRALVRKLIDIGDVKTAYAVARDATTPTRPAYRVDQPFTAGWVALRFLRDAKLALEHFNKVAVDTKNPVAKARAAYWKGRAHEVLGHAQEARSFYETAAQYTTAYYGQIAAGKLGAGDLTVRPAPAPAPNERAKALKDEVVRAVELLYHINERDLAAIMAVDSGENSDDPAKLALIGELTQRYDDGRSMLLLGKAALNRGMPFDVYAFPTIGMPHYQPIGPPIEIALLYSIARQESGFNPRIVSTANALGLMQVTPEAGRYVTGKFKVAFDQSRLLKDTVYNTQVGAAELGDVLRDYRGSYILSFVGYNAGRGRAKEWIAKFGDPRDPKIDPIDWVERIPFSETRNYVQRVMENLQVYRVRFGSSTRLMIEADLRRGGSGGVH